MADRWICLIILHISDLPLRCFYAVQHDIQREQLIFVFLLGCRYIKVNLPAEIGRHLFIFRDGNNGIHTVNGGINSLRNIYVVKTRDRIALIRFGLYRTRAAQRRIDGRQALLTVQYQKIRLSIGLWCSLYHTILEMNIVVAIF